MSILDISPANLRTIVSLAEKREGLLSEVAKIETQIRALEGSKPETGKKPGKVRKASSAKPAGGRRGKVKDLIIAELQAAGKGGVSVKELAPKLGLKAQNLHVWFNTTGKKLGAKRIGPGKYRL